MRPDPEALAAAVTNAARAGDHRGVAALLDKAGDRNGRAAVVIAAVAQADSLFAMYRQSVAQYRDAARSAAAQKSGRLLAALVQDLAEASGVTRDEIRAEALLRQLGAVVDDESESSHAA